MRAVEVLACVSSRIDGAAGAVVSIMCVASETGLVFHQARAALQRLIRKGAIEATPRNYPNGGSAENSYRITPAGFALLDAVERPSNEQ